MSGVRDLSSLLAGCVGLLASMEPKVFLLAILVGILLAAACWIACLYFSRLWNLAFHMTPTHHLLAGVAAIVTLLFTVLFVSLKYTEEAALASIYLWQEQINRDMLWSSQVFAQAYEAVRRLNIEDFSQDPPPQTGGHLIPVSHDESRKLVASIYADGACRHFNTHRSFLSAIVRPEVPSAKIDEDQHAWFAQHPNSNYDLSRAVELAASQIRSGLIPQTPRVILVARILAVAGFTLAQAVPFGLIAHAAYKDLKVTT
jgi:hypothetical protein